MILPWRRIDSEIHSEFQGEKEARSSEEDDLIDHVCNEFVREAVVQFTGSQINPSDLASSKINNDLGLSRGRSQLGSPMGSHATGNPERKPAERSR